MRGGAMTGQNGNRRREPAGIVIRVGIEEEKKPAISAFIWGGKVLPVPTLPYGRWKPKAA
jgi:hypothetical protein